MIYDLPGIFSSASLTEMPRETVPKSGCQMWLSPTGTPDGKEWLPLQKE
jgi:hypothetical protein